MQLRISYLLIPLGLHMLICRITTTYYQLCTCRVYTMYTQHYLSGYVGHLTEALGCAWPEKLRACYIQIASNCRIQLTSGQPQHLSVRALETHHVNIHKIYVYTRNSLPVIAPYKKRCTLCLLSVQHTLAGKMSSFSELKATNQECGLARRCLVY